MPTVDRVVVRLDAERAVVAELEAWRGRMVPDPSVSFDADALAHLVRACCTALGIDPEVGAGFTVNTVHYYRRKDILDEPAGRTSSARYGVRHLWQAVGARLAGHLGLLTLAEARKAMRGADEGALVAFVATRVVDARARQRLRETTASSALGARSAAVMGVRSTEYAPAVRARPLPGVLAAAARPAAPEPATRESVTPVVIPLPGGAWCILPASHPAHDSATSAREVVTALADALRVSAR